MCNRLPEVNKNGDAGIFPVYYSLKSKYTVDLDSWCSLFLFGCPCMAINVIVQYSGGFLPDIILLTKYDYIGDHF